MTPIHPNTAQPQARQTHLPAEDTKDSPEANSPTFENLLRVDESGEFSTGREAEPDLVLNELPEEPAEATLPTLALASDTSSFAALGVLISRDMASAPQDIPHHLAKPSSELPTDLVPVPSQGDDATSFAAMGLDPALFASLPTMNAPAAPQPGAARASIGRTPQTVRGRVTASLQRLSSMSARQGITQGQSRASQTRGTSFANQDAILARLLSEGSNNSVDVKVVRGETGIVLLLGLPSGEAGSEKALERRLTRLVESMGERVERIEYRTLPSRAADPGRAAISFEENL